MVRGVDRQLGRSPEGSAGASGNESKGRESMTSRKGIEVVYPVCCLARREAQSLESPGMPGRGCNDLVGWGFLDSDVIDFPPEHSWLKTIRRNTSIPAPPAVDNAPFQGPLGTLKMATKTHLTTR